MSTSEILNSAWKLRRQGRYDEVSALLTSLSHDISPDDHLVHGRIAHIRMQVHSDHDRLKDALEHCRIAIAHYAKSGNENLIAHGRRHLADLLSATGSLEEARENYEFSLQIYRSMKKPMNPDLANALRGYALLLEKKKINSTHLWEEIREIYVYHGISEGIKEAESHLKS